MRQDRKVAIAVIAFAGTHDHFAYRIRGEGDEPGLELERFMEAVDRQLERLDPFYLQILAQQVFDEARCNVFVAMDFDEADIPAILAESEISQMRTV